MLGGGSLIAFEMKKKKKRKKPSMWHVERPRAVHRGRSSRGAVVGTGAESTAAYCGMIARSRLVGTPNGCATVMRGCDGDEAL